MFKTKVKSKQASKAGRKGKYAQWIENDGLKRIESWARDGLSTEQIAHNIGIATTTLRDWMGKFNLISEAIKRGKAPVDFEVENALYKSAIGYTVKVKKAIKVKTKKQLKDKGMIEEEHVELVDEEQYIEPKTAAQIFWLKNRKPAEWQDRRQIDADVRNVPVQIIDDIPFELPEE